MSNRSSRRESARSRPRIPIRTGRRDWLWGLALGAVVLVVGAGVFLASQGSDSAGATIEGVECEAGERLEYHVHAKLTLVIEGQEQPVDGGIGLPGSCVYWLHTHGPDGIIHVEAPEQRDFTLGQLFAVWGEYLSETQLLDNLADGGKEVQAFVNGERFEGDPADIPLADQESIVLQYGPPFVDPNEFQFSKR